MMPLQNDRRPWNVRALLESTETPFAVADYRPRAVLFHQGDPCDSVMYIERGRVWLAVMARSGKEAICGVLGSGAFLGEEALAGCRERPQSATAMASTEVLVVAKADMSRLLRTQSGLTGHFIAHLIARHTRLEVTLTDQLLHSSEERLAHVLLALASCDERRPGRYVLPHLPQEIIAEMVGTTRSRVNAFMGKFKKLGFLEGHRGMLHVNPGRLHAVRDGGRPISLAASPALPQAAEAEGRRWPLEGS
ncbi:MAG: Crp/Fnr family transcriptional regulator [Vicinamibacterales bacterium]|nr:Crp/Fnr family transcriptional regulator [Vicinamibacterales bacterium]